MRKLFLFQNVWLLQLNFTKFHFFNIRKWSDIDVTSGKAVENHMTCAPFENLVEWKIWKGSKSHNQKGNFAHKKGRLIKCLG